MSVSQTATVPRAHESPVHQFRCYETAVEAMARYQAALCRNASRRRASGLAVTDQDQPEEVFCLFPASPEGPPLAIVGGMGPMAGSVAFRQACEHFRNSRAIVLYQACSVPDRSAVILCNRNNGRSVREVAARLGDAVRFAISLIGESAALPRCILACNSAHYFWPMVLDDLRTTAAQPCPVRMISLVECALGALRVCSHRRALVLETEGARTGEVFSAPFRGANISFDQPPPALSRLLMSAIFEGIKALDERRAVDLGNEFFEAILRSGRDYDCVLAGCTEIPLTINLLRQRGSPAVMAFLNRVRIIDPLEEALRHA